MTQGVKLGSTQVKLAGVDPRVVAGDTRDGGGRRKSSSGDQMSGGEALLGAGDRAHQMGQAGAAGVD